MATILTGEPMVGDIAVTTTEQQIQFEKECFEVLLYTDLDCLISIGDNTHYKKYPGGVAIPITNTSGVTSLYVKTSSGTASLGVWGMR